MKNNLKFLSLLMALGGCGSLFCACNSDDTFLTDGSCRLTLPHDTLEFDTVLCGVGSATKSFFLHNANGDGVHVQQVYLEKGASSPFKINVDGVPLVKDDDALKTDFDIRGKDSVRVFAEVLLPKMTSAEHTDVTDYLVFDLGGGVKQRMALHAYGQGVTQWTGVRITDNTRLVGENILITDSVIVEPGATLQLEAGTTLYFHDGAYMRVYGTLQAVGTPQQWVTFRCDRTDKLFANLPYDRVSGKWGGVELMPGSQNNVVQWTDIHGGDYGIRAWGDGASTQLTLENSILHNVDGNGLELNNTVANCGNVLFSNAYGYCVSVRGGSQQFVYCTMAQFYPWRSGAAGALFLSNCTEDGQPSDLADLSLYNCLATGYNEQAVKGQLSDDSSTQLNVSFRNSVIYLKDDGTDDWLTRENLWYSGDNKDKEKLTSSKQFKVFDTTNYFYDFRLLPASFAVGKADAVWNAKYPTDLSGRVRDAYAPSVGCYEPVPEEE